MRTRTGAICESLIEAGWLLALIIVPLYFNVYSSRVFEPDKLAILRSLASLMALAGLVQFVDARLQRSAAGAGETAGALSWRAPLVLPVAALAAVYVLATALSVTPRVSLWGSYQRLQGTYSTLSYLVIFCLLLVNLRRREQLERLLTVAVLTSLPISLYGLLQHYRLDPLPWGGDTTFRVAANMGNPIFVAAYLIMVVPLTMARLARQIGRAAAGAARVERAAAFSAVGLVLAVQILAWALWGFSWGLAAAAGSAALLGAMAVLRRKAVGEWVLIAAYATVLGAQLTCTFFTQSRGPWLGLGAGLFFMALLYVSARGWRRTALALAAAAALGAGLIGVLNVPGSPLAALREVPYVGRLGQLLETESGTGKVRLLIWEAATEMLAADPARAVVGYGPESMYVAFNPFYPPELAHYEARNRSPDRAHNETYDALLTTGVVGLATYMALFAALFYHGLRWLGLLGTPRRRRAFALSGALGAGLGIAAPWALDGSARYVGVGLPLGFIGGLGAYVMGVALSNVLRRDAPGSASGAPPERLLLVAALLGAIVAHFVEIHFGIAIAATRVYFWAYAGLLVVLGQGLLAREEALPQTAAAPPATPPRGRAARRRSAGRRAPSARPANDRGTLAALRAHPVAAPALLVGISLAVMAWDYTTNPLLADNPVAVLLDAWTTLAGTGRPEMLSVGVVAMFLATFLVGGALIWGLAPRREGEVGGAGRGAAVALYAALGGGLGLIYAVWHAGALTRVAGPTALVDAFYVFLAVGWLALAGLLLARAPAPAPAAAGGRPWRRLAAPLAGAPLAVAVLLLIQSRNLGVVRADVVYKEGYQYDLRGAWEQAAAFYERAHRMEPIEDYYLLFLGRARLEQAAAETDPARREAHFAGALDALVEARRLNPLNTDHTANIARLHRRWALVDPDPAAAEAKRHTALAMYDAAVRLSPNNAGLRNERALLYLDLGQAAAAESQYAESLAIDGQYAQTYLLVGDMYYDQEDWRRAAWAYERAIEVDGGSLQAWAGLGNCHAQLEEWAEAIHAFQRAIEADYRSPQVWAMLGDAYSRLGDLEAAADAYQRAVALDGAYTEAWRALGIHLAHLERWEDAEGALGRLLELAPDDYTAHRGLAQVLAHTGRGADALPHAERAAALAPEAERAAAEALLDQVRALAGKETS